MTLPFAPTLRAVITAVFAVFIGIAFTWQNNDVLATYAVISLSATLLLSGVIVFFYGLRIRRRIRINIEAGLPIGSRSTTIHSGEPASISLTVSEIAIFPFTSLEVRLSYADEKNPSLHIALDASSDINHPLNIQTVFPHRGVWHIKEVNWIFQDIFGFWRFQGGSLQMVHQEGTSVYPPSESFTSRPPLYSSMKDGDDSASLSQLGGDLYDIKRYHPADGIRKVVWKVFARTGELLSRHPEKTMIPDGRVILYVIGGQQADAGFFQCYRYMQELRQQGLEVLASASLFGHMDPISDPDVFLEQSVVTAFSDSSMDGIDHLLSESTLQLNITQIGLFIDLASTHKDELASLIEHCRYALLALKERNITPQCFYIDQEYQIPSSWDGIFNYTKRLFIEPEAVERSELQQIKKSLQAFKIELQEGSYL